MAKVIKLIVLTSKEVLLSEIEEVGAEVGEPDCQLINPFICKTPDDKILSKLDSAFKEKGKRANNAIKNNFFIVFSNLFEKINETIILTHYHSSKRINVQKKSASRTN